MREQLITQPNPDFNRPEAPRPYIPESKPETNQSLHDWVQQRTAKRLNDLEAGKIPLEGLMTSEKMAFLEDWMEDHLDQTKADQLHNEFETTLPTNAVAAISEYLIRYENLFQMSALEGGLENSLIKHPEKIQELWNLQRLTDDLVASWAKAHEKKNAEETAQLTTRRILGNLGVNQSVIKFGPWEK